MSDINSSCYLISVLRGSTHLEVNSVTASPTPQKLANTSIPSSVHTVLSTSKHTALALLIMVFACSTEQKFRKWLKDNLGRPLWRRGWNKRSIVMSERQQNGDHYGQ